MKTLYPLKFHPLFKERIWGGNKLRTVLGKDAPATEKIGESWEISAVKDNVSIVNGGPLDGESLTFLIDEYKGELVGDSVYGQFGNQFPLLIKFLDAQDDLSIQLHPNDELAQKRHNSFGKTEMWYVFQADEGSIVRSGFNGEVNKDIYLEHLNNKQLDKILNLLPAKPDDVFFLPSGRVHSIGKGLLIAEIQQTSDVTYRIYDFDRKDDQGKTRELHTEEAIDAIDYAHYDEYKARYDKKLNAVSNVVDCPYFTTNRLHCNAPVNRDYNGLDSFVIYVCVEGALSIEYAGGSVSVQKGDAILLPAAIKKVTLKPSPECKLLETYIAG